MTDQQKDTQAAWEGMPFAEMMQKMMGQKAEGCGCADRMSQMMTMCCDTQEKGKTEGAAEKAA